MNRRPRVDVTENGLAACNFNFRETSETPAGAKFFGAQDNMKLMTDETTNSPEAEVDLPADRRKATGRLIATFGSARILRHRDGSLDVLGATASERNAALAWICAVSPDLALRVRRCPAPDA